MFFLIPIRPGARPPLDPMELPLEAPLAALTVAVTSGILHLLVGFVQLPSFLFRCLKTLLESRVPGPVTKIVLSPVVAGSAVLLPVVAAAASAGCAFGLAYRRPQAGWEICSGLFQSYRKRAADTAVEELRQSLDDPGRLGFPL